MPIVNRIADYADDMRAWRRHLHQNPELSLDCHETAKFVVARLREFGITEIHEGIAESGVVAIIEGQGEGPVTALRADMDALPMDEETGAEHASLVPGKMHACGHDGHTTMLLGAARYLAETRNFAGKVALIFQPAEETIGGGRIMVEDGIMDRFGVSEVYAIHTDPSLPLGTMATTKGPIMAAVDDFELVLTGKGGHAAHPDLCIDPVPCALAIGQALLSVPSRNADPLKSLVVSLTTVQGGSATNVIPETVRLAGTIRSFDPGIRAMAERRLREIVSGQAMAYGVSADLDFQPNYPPTVNHAAQTEFAVKVAQGVVPEVLDEIAPSMGAEDFSYMLEARPGAFVYLGQGIGPSVHHPKFDFNDEAAPLGASYFVKIVETRQPLRA